MRLYDISPLVHPGIPVWPGDTPFSVRRTSSIDATGADPRPSGWASVTVSSIATTPHVGAHADAPLHTEENGAAIDELDLEPYLGRCLVVAVPPLALIGLEHLDGIDLAATPRLLLKTRSVRDWTRFPDPGGCSAIAPVLAERLGEAGVRLVGIDTPSVDPLDSKTLETHRIFNRYGVRNLENLLLGEVPPGAYELIALPLRLRGLDASPVRAVLLPMK